MAKKRRSSTGRVKGDRLGADDWAEAALHAMLDGGVSGVKIPALARSLGVTKGNFYWHFESHAELIERALLRWERQSTEAIIADLDPDAEPTDVLRALGHRMLREPRHGMLELVLAADARHPHVNPVLSRVMERRLSFVTSVIEQAGLPAASARHRALIAYAAFVGFHQVMQVDPRRAPKRAERDAFVCTWIGGLLAPIEPVVARRSAT